MTDVLMITMRYLPALARVSRHFWAEYREHACEYDTAWRALIKYSFESHQIVSISDKFRNGNCDLVKFSDRGVFRGDHKYQIICWSAVEQYGPKWSASIIVTGKPNTCGATYEFDGRNLVTIDDTDRSELFTHITPWVVSNTAEFIAYVTLSGPSGTDWSQLAAPPPFLRNVPQHLLDNITLHNRWY